MYLVCLNPSGLGSWCWTIYRAPWMMVSSSCSEQLFHNVIRCGLKSLWACWTVHSPSQTMIWPENDQRPLRSKIFEDRMGRGLWIKFNHILNLRGILQAGHRPIHPQAVFFSIIYPKQTLRSKSIPILKSAWLAHFKSKFNAIFSYIQPDIQFANPLSANTRGNCVSYPKRTLGSKTSQFWRAHGLRASN
jgi:hypothetical protein